MVEFLLGGQSRLKPLFVWGVDKCLDTRIAHPQNPQHMLVLKHMDKVWREMNLGFRELGPTNTLLIDDYPYKCLGNVLCSYILSF